MHINKKFKCKSLLRHSRVVTHNVSISWYYPFILSDDWYVMGFLLYIIARTNHAMTEYMECAEIFKAQSKGALDILLSR